MRPIACLLLFSLSTAAGADDTLTPLGAEQAGNAAGTIPAWSGGITAPPPRYDPNQHPVDPYPDDPVLYTVDASNAERYAESLSAGQLALLRKYPTTWRMRVYPTHRSAAFPQFVYDAVLANQATAHVEPGLGGVRGSTVGSAFRQPANGLEAIWNQNLRWRGQRVERTEGSAAVTGRGRYQVVLSLQDLAFPYAWPNAPADGPFANVLLAIKTRTVLPSQLTGEGGLVLDTIDQTRDPRKVWRYLPSLRRMLRAPNFGYAAPSPHADGLRTIDEFELFFGPTDRFDWSLLGKREMLIPYNAYRIGSDAVTTAEILGKRHINPELVRYELHRVWVVEARLKAGAKHVYGRRVFYLDEDSWQVALSDSYDLTGQLWRTAETHAVNYYQVPVLWATLHVFYDLKSGRYLVDGLDNSRAPYRFTDKVDPREFTPNELNYYLR
jgi:Protein of unknown function (DUF1329)